MKKSKKMKVLAALLLGASVSLTLGAFSVENASAEVNKDTFAMIKGAGVRLVEPYGIRFRAQLGEDVYKDVMSPEANETKKVGMYIVPSSYVNNAAAYSDGIVGNYQNFKQKTEVVFYDSDDATVENKIYSGGDEYYYANGVIANLNLQNYGREFIGIAYVETTNTSTNVITYEFADFDLEATARTATYVASAAYDDYASSRDVLTNYVYGAYLYDQKGMTYDGETYKIGESEYASIKEAVEGQNCSFNLALSQETLSLNAMSSATLTATYQDGSVDTGLDLAVDWASSNQSVVKVENGVLTGMNTGSAIVTASVLGLSKQCVVTVEDARQTQMLQAQDFGRSNSYDLVMEGITGNVGNLVALTATNGTTTVDLLDYATASYSEQKNESTITVANEALTEFSLEEWTVVANATGSIVEQKVTISDYALCDTDSFVEWYNYLKTADSNMPGKTVVVSNSFTYTGDVLSIDWSKGRIRGTFDGKGNVIDGLKFAGPLFGGIAAQPFKNIAFTNMVQTRNTGNGFLARYGSYGQIENVFVSGVVQNNTGYKTDSIFETVNGGGSVTNCVFNVSNMSGANDAFFCYSIDNGAVAVENVFAISDTKTTFRKITTATTNCGIYASATAEFMAKVGAMTNTTFTVQNNAVYFNGTKVLEGEKAEAQLNEVFFALTDTKALTIGGFTGTPTKVTVGGVDVTANCTLSDGGATIAYDTASAYTTGEKALVVETSATVYTGVLTVADYVIGDTTSFLKWYDYLKTADANSAVKYVVVSNSFTYTGDVLSIDASKGRIRGTFDGKGNVIDGLKFAGPLFGGIAAQPFKNIAFTNMVQTRNTGNGFLARYGSYGQIENVFVSGVVQNNTGYKTDSIFETVNGGGSVKNCVFNVSNMSGASDPVFCYANDNGAMTVENVFAISDTKTTFRKVTTATTNCGVYASATSDFMAKVSAMSNTLFTVQNNAVYFNGTKVIGE